MSNLLPEWDPERIRERLPVVLATVGARRSGKSTAVAHLAYLMFDTFDLIIGFVGSAACSPCLEAMMERHPKWSSDFFFPKWNQPLITALLEQQERLKKAGEQRQILILCDDVILGSKDEEQLAHMAMRGRHFGISIMISAVSYTSINKRVRRSLDFLLCYSLPMNGDRKVLSWEFSSNTNTSDYMLQNLHENECLVFETSQKQQRLKTWKAVLLEPYMFKTQQLPDLRCIEKQASHELLNKHRSAYHQTKNNSSQSCTQSKEQEPNSASEQTQSYPSVSENESTYPSPSTAPALNEQKRSESED